jgi:ABC-type branched-subunit amino acid transport system substrate-binding protein
MIWQLLPFQGRAREKFLSRRNFVRPGSYPGFLRGLAGAFAFGALALLAACNSTRVGDGFGRGPSVQAAQPVTGETLGTGNVRVALLLPLSATGNAGQIALAFRNAADLALRDFKTAGIQILIKDDQGTADGARAAASEAISQGAELILGPLFARSVNGVSQVARAARVPVIAFSSDTTTAGQGLYLLSFLPQSDVDRIVSFAASRGKRSIAALLPNNAYGTLVEAALQRAAANAGGRVMASQRYDLDKTAMQAQATQVAGLIKGGTVDAVLLPDAGDAVPFLAQVLAANGVTPDKMTYLGSGQWDNDARITAESNLSGAFYPAPESGGFASFSKRYQAAFGSAPSRTASLAYDATSLAAGLAARFGDQRFADATLTNPNGFIGIDGAFRFLPNGLNQRGLAVYQIQKGQATMVDPAPKTFTRAPGT